MSPPVEAETHRAGRPDATLAGREPRLPGLAVVLDADALLECLDALLAPQIDRPTAARVNYVRYKPGTSIVAGVTLQTPAGPLAAFAKAVGPASPKLEKARRRPARTDAGWGVVVDATRRLAVGTAASDRRLPGAARLGRGPAPDVLRYKPERRLVTRGTHRGRPALLKAHQPPAAAAAAAAHHALAAAGAPVAELLAADRRRGVVACAWAAGTPLCALDDHVGATRAAGAALARLHRAPALGLPGAPSPRRELDAAADAVGALVPGLAARAGALARRLAPDRLPAGSSLGPVHGDWSADQALHTAGGEAVLVDLDRARRGDPATDIASWIAAEHVAGHPAADDHPEDVAAALLWGHADAGGPPLVDLHAPTAAALLSRAVEPFRTRHPDWPTEIERLLDLAERHACHRPW